MAIPTVIGVSAAAASSLTTAVPAFPTSYTATTDDIGIIFAETESADTLVPPTGWTAVINSIVSSGTTTRLWAIWRRIQAGDTAPTIADPGDHQVARMIVVRGCATSGNPWDQTTQTTEAVADTTVSIPTVTTSVNDCLILAAFGTGQDIASTAGATGWTNAALSGLTEQMDNWDTIGTGGGFAMATGGKAAAGATGATTATLSLTANFKTLITIALRPPPVVFEVNRLARSPRPSEQPQASGNYAPPVQSQIIGG